MTQTNGSQQQVQVNPIECARFALIFLSRADFKAGERQMFDLAESLLRAIVDGRVSLAPTEPQPGAMPLMPQPSEPLQ